MSQPLPVLNLTHGQVAWALSSGQDPDQLTLDQLRYLRQLGVPFTPKEQGTGTGNPLTYDYDHYIETGVALYMVRRSMKPQDIAKVLITFRDDLRAQYREAFTVQSFRAIQAEWVKSHGRMIPMLIEERFLRLHDRYSDKPGSYEMVLPHDSADPKLLADQRLQIGDTVERYPGEDARTLVPISRLVLEFVAWAQEAPAIRAGRP